MSLSGMKFFVIDDVEKFLPALWERHSERYKKVWFTYEMFHSEALRIFHAERAGELNTDKIWLVSLDAECMTDLEFLIQNGKLLPTTQMKTLMVARRAMKERELYVEKNREQMSDDELLEWRKCDEYLTSLFLVVNSPFDVQRSGALHELSESLGLPGSDAAAQAERERKNREALKKMEFLHEMKLKNEMDLKFMEYTQSEMKKLTEDLSDISSNNHSKSIRERLSAAQLRPQPKKDPVELLQESLNSSYAP